MSEDTFRGHYEVRFGKVGWEFKEWVIPNIEKIDFNGSKSETVIAIPTRTSDYSQVFDMQGPLLAVNMEFTRRDYDEKFCNWDFLFGNRMYDGVWEYTGIANYIGLFTTTDPFRLTIRWVPSYIWEPDPQCIMTGVWNVSVDGSLSMRMDAQKIGEGRFNLSLTIRRGK